VSVLVWVLIGIALWHFTVLLPDRFHGGIIGAFLYAVAGALLTGWALPEPGALGALGFAYWWGGRADRGDGE
jgi:hypothetical protein